MSDYLTFEQGEKIISLLEKLVGQPAILSARKTDYIAPETLVNPNGPHAELKYENFPEKLFPMTFWYERPLSETSNADPLMQPHSPCGNASENSDRFREFMYPDSFNGMNQHDVLHRNEHHNMRFRYLDTWEENKHIGTNMYMIDLWTVGFGGGAVATLSKFGNIISDMSEQARKLVANGEMVLVIRSDGEGFSVDEHNWVSNIHQQMIGFGMQNAKVAVTSGDLLFRKNYEKWCDAYPHMSNQFRFKAVLPHDYFHYAYLLEYVKRVGLFDWEEEVIRPQRLPPEDVGSGDSYTNEWIQEVPTDGQKEKNFLCYMAASRSHRLALYSELLRRNLVDDSYVSFLFRYAHLRNEGGKAWNQLNGFHDNHLREVSELLLKGPEQVNWLTHAREKDFLQYRELDISHVGVSSDDRQFNKEHYINSYFSLVAETKFVVPWNISKDHQDTPLLGEDAMRDRNECLFVTEKTYKPIMNYHPFVIVGNTGTLAYLREEGYATFPEMFDESYDEMENANDRFQAILSEVEKFCKLDDGEKRKRYRAVLPAIVHNRKHYLGSFNKLRKRHLHWLLQMGKLIE
tara:strand:- start:596 stop:2314 length:1719 start_codon:yes stop_codon:yes gene_type:complete